MAFTAGATAQRDNLAGLQAVSLRAIALFVALPGYAWMMHILHPLIGAKAP